MGGSSKSLLDILRSVLQLTVLILLYSEFWYMFVFHYWKLTHQVTTLFHIIWDEII